MSFTSEPLLHLSPPPPHHTLVHSHHLSVCCCSYRPPCFIPSLFLSVAGCCVVVPLMSGSSSLLSSVFLRRPSSAPCFLQVLPLAVSVSIVTYLPLPSIASCSAVSALLFVLCQDERVWRQLCRTRWSRLQHARSLLTALEWSTLYGEEERELNGQEEEHSTGGRKDRDSGTAEGCLSALSWKERYVAAEVDLCRSYITLPEVMKTRWAFRFLPNVFFDHR